MESDELDDHKKRGKKTKIMLRLFLVVAFFYVLRNREEGSGEDWAEGRTTKCFELPAGSSQERKT